MIHEALFYLWNCPGDVFKTNTEEEWINSVDMQEFLHPGEKKLLQRIMAIAISYHKIQTFIKSVDSQQNNLYEIHADKDSKEGDDDAVLEIATLEIKPGLYIRAFCNGVDEVLADYRKELINLEDTLLKNPQLTLTYVLSCVEKYVTLFEALKSMIELIKREKIHGCLLMGKLHSYINCGVTTISEAANRIIISINTLFYRHLCNWIIYGDLVDNCNEFFIVDGKCADEDFLYPEQKTSETSIREPLQNSFHKNKIRKQYTVRKFYLKKEMVPPNISLETAETILFIGRVVWIVRNDPKRLSDDKFYLKFKRDVWEGKDVEYYRKLQSLESDPFSLPVFDKAIEECRLKLTKYLWKIMVEEAKLLEHLQLIRDYYALGRGELFQQFIVVFEDHLKAKQMPIDYIVTNLNFIFVETARKLYSENDKSFSRFELTLPPNQDTPIDDENLWTRLEINFDIQWPLHILFHPKAMSLYNKLFCFLLRVKKTHIDLHKLWLMHMEGKSEIDTALWTLRNNLMFIVNNLQYYLQVDVIEAQFSIFKNAVLSANEFEDIIRLHSRFLKNLLNKSFVLTGEEKADQEGKHTLYQTPSLKTEENSVIYKTIIEILHVCDEFCSIVYNWSGRLNTSQHEELNKLKNKSNALIETLLHFLYSLHEKSSGHHLLQLLHHIDFNRWFSKKNESLNLTVAF